VKALQLRSLLSSAAGIMMIASVVVAGAMLSCVDAAQAKTDTAGGIYSYRDDDIPDVFFFPKEKARWDGSKVTMKEWYLLTELQKQKFVSEYIAELQKQYNQSIEVIGLDYLRALNVFSYYSNENSMNEPSTKFVDKLLSGQGKIISKPSSNQGEAK